MASDKPASDPSPGAESPADEGSEKPGFEQALAALEKIVAELESGQLSLNDAIRRYEQGVKMLRHCHARLKHAEQKISLLTKVQADGTFEVAPFENEAPRPGKRGAAAPRRRSSRTGDDRDTGNVREASGSDDELLF